MGQRANGVKGDQAGSGAIEPEISSIRDELGALVSELDRRRRDLFDLRGHVRRHPLAASLTGVAVAAILGGSVALLVYETRRRQRASYRAKQLRIAVGRMMDHPERVARGDAPPGEKILAAVGAAVATLLVKRVMARAAAVPQVAQKAQGQGQAQDGRSRARA